MKKKKIYLHIGFGKTGTTSIQKMLHAGRANLLKQDILYPNTGILQYGHHNLAVLGQENMDRNIETLFKTLIKEIEDTEAQRIILSSENFIFMKPSYIQMISNFLRDFDVQILIYIRKQSSLIESTYMEWLKTGKPYQNSINKFYNLHKQSFDFMYKIKPWIQIFEKKNIIARLFDKKIIGNDVCLDFLYLLNIKQLDIGDYSNQSLSTRFLELLYLIDQLNISITERKKIVDELLVLSKNINEKKSILSITLLEEFEKYYHNSNLEFANTFLSEEERKVFLKNYQE